jgi:hypothetical protein
MKNILFAVLLVIAGALGAFMFLRVGGNNVEQEQGPLHADHAPADHPHESDFCAEHQITEADCPWCDPSLVASRGECPEHGVPEALCSACNPKLIAGFKAEHDWCGGHSVPESQCDLCKSGQYAPGEEPH